LVTFVVLTAIVIARINLSMDTVSQRADWRNLVARDEGSGFHSLRGNVNYVSLTGAPFTIAVASAIGAATGVIGGVIGRIGRLGVSPGA
jgi:hypothetical protein